MQEYTCTYFLQHENAFIFTAVKWTADG